MVDDGDVARPQPLGEVLGARSRRAGPHDARRPFAGAADGEASQSSSCVRVCQTHPEGCSSRRAAGQPARLRRRCRRQQLLGVATSELRTPGSPASMRDSSARRSSPSTRRHAGATDASSLATTRCRSANAATCGRCVTTSTWRCGPARPAAGRPRPRRGRRRPRRPRRRRTSGTGSAPASTTSRASMTRDSSPPDAPLCSGRGGASRVRDEQELDLVDAVRSERHPPTVREQQPVGRRSRWRDRHLQPGVRHRQPGQLARRPPRSAAALRPRCAAPSASRRMGSELAVSRRARR